MAVLRAKARLDYSRELRIDHEILCVYLQGSPITFDEFLFFYSSPVIYRTYYTIFKAK